MRKVFYYILISLIISVLVFLLAFSKILNFNGVALQMNNSILNKSDTKSIDKSGSITYLSYWTWIPTGKQQEVMINEFEKENPGIKIAGYGFNFDDYVKKVKVALASREGPDLIGMQMGAFFTETKRFLTELKELADKEFGNGWENEVDMSDVQEAIKYSGDGKLYTMPIGVSSQMFVYYNRTIFDECGIKPPNNYEEWKTVNEVLRKKRNDILPLTIGLKDVWFSTDLFTLLANQIAPGITVKADNGLIKWTDPVFVKAMNNIKKLKDDKIFSDDVINTYTYPTAADLFANRKCVQWAVGSWAAYTMGNSSVNNSKGFPVENDEFGAFILPNVNGGNPVVIGGIDTGISINKESVHKDEAIKFIKFMTLGKGQEIFANTYCVLPVKIGQNIDTENFPEAGKQGLKLFVDALKYNMVSTRQVTNPLVKDKIGLEVQNVFNGEDVKTALENIQKVTESVND